MTSRENLLISLAILKCTYILFLDASTKVPCNCLLIFSHSERRVNITFFMQYEDCLIN